MLIFPSGWTRTFDLEEGIFFPPRECDSELMPARPRLWPCVLFAAADQSVGRGRDGPADGNRWDTSRPFPFPAGWENVITQGWWGGKTKINRGRQTFKSQSNGCLRTPCFLAVIYENRMLDQDRVWKILVSERDSFIWWSFKIPQQGENVFFHIDLRVIRRTL